VRRRKTAGRELRLVSVRLDGQSRSNVLTVERIILGIPSVFVRQRIGSARL